MKLRQLELRACIAVLERNRLGHLACTSDGLPYIVPLHYAWAQNYLYAFSMPGRKIDALRHNAGAAMLIEEIDTPQRWRSVLVRGSFEELPDQIGFKRQRDHAWQLLSRHNSWWEPGSYKPEATGPVPGAQPIFFRITADEITGRESLAED